MCGFGTSIPNKRLLPAEQTEHISIGGWLRLVRPALTKDHSQKARSDAYWEAGLANLSTVIFGCDCGAQSLVFGDDGTG